MVIKDHFKCLRSFPNLVDITAGNYQKDKSNNQKSKTGSFKTNNSWNASEVWVPSVAIFTGCAPIVVNIALLASLEAFRPTLIGVFVVKKISSITN